MTHEPNLHMDLKRVAGVLLPLFSVHSKKSLGIGDFSDLKLLADWASLTGNSIIQLLPMNEMGALFCPYDSISSFALEPAYISIQDLPLANKKSIQDQIKYLKEIYPAGREYVNYSIKKVKLQLLWDIFLSWDHSDSLELKRFEEENAYWLLDFALFKVLKERNAGKPWYEWEDKFKNHDSKVLQNFFIEHQKEVQFQNWVQWQLFKQSKDALAFSHAKGVRIKGDLPILVSRDSADVWAHPEFFKLDFAAGAPPDMYCAKGQRWGMPTYNWQKIEADGFRYLKEKLKFAQNFYDIIRIDHVVGLFRIWSIPYSEPIDNMGLNGCFDPKDEFDWGGQGRKLLSVIEDNTDMLLCAEDLGVIPQVCTDTLRDLGIPGNDVSRWVKDWKVKHDFLKPLDYRVLSVAMLSTHDTTNWPAWWENEAGTVDEVLFRRKCCDHRQINFTAVKAELFDMNRSRHGRLRWLESIDSTDKLVSVLGKRREELADFIDLYENSYLEKEKLWKLLKMSGSMREKCDSEIMRRAMKMSLGTSSVFCVNTLIDWLYLTDLLKSNPYHYRINTPGTISDRNWSLTIPISLEDLSKHPVNNEIRQMIASSGRI